jgi:hypothetical protein
LNPDPAEETIGIGEKETYFYAHPEPFQIGFFTHGNVFEHFKGMFYSLEKEESFLNKFLCDGKA